MIWGQIIWCEHNIKTYCCWNLSDYIIEIPIQVWIVTPVSFVALKIYTSYPYESWVVEPITGQLYGLEKFWAFLKYTRKQNIVVDVKLTGYLSKFKRLEDFRIQEVSVAKSKACVMQKLGLCYFLIWAVGDGLNLAWHHFTQG